MLAFKRHKEELDVLGYSLTDVVLSKKEIRLLGAAIKKYSSNFSVRQLVKKVPQVLAIILKNPSFTELFQTICGTDYFLSKAIYFNKQNRSNWFVGYHQDISIGVEKKIIANGYAHWTRKKDLLGVIPPVTILESIVTFRIHLDNVNDNNGALKIIEKSHQKGIIRIDENFDPSPFGREVICNARQGQVMLMKPLLLHASDRLISKSDRRIIHLEFCNKDIPMGWSEKKKIS